MRRSGDDTQRPLELLPTVFYSSSETVSTNSGQAEIDRRVLLRLLNHAAATRLADHPQLYEEQGFADRGALPARQG
jgi:hypothetical protein